jgi:hypothetical protein
MFSTDVIRWHEQSVRTSYVSGVESAGTTILNPLVNTTINSPTIQIPIPRVKTTKSTYRGNYILLKSYNGFVTAVSEQSFTARLYTSGSDYPVMEAEFDLEELSLEDRKLVAEGAALVWTMGYHDQESRKRESLIYMRRRPGWDKKEIEQAKLATEELTRDIQWK